MPHPPDPPIQSSRETDLEKHVDMPGEVQLLQSIMSALLNECSAAAVRHQEIMDKLCSTESSCTRQDKTESPGRSQRTGYGCDADAKVLQFVESSVSSAATGESSVSSAATDAKDSETPKLYKRAYTTMTLENIISAEDELSEDGTVAMDSQFILNSHEVPSPAYPTAVKNFLRSLGRVATSHSLSDLYRRKFNRLLLRKILKSLKFEGCVLAIICMNAVTLCLEAQYEGFQVGFDLQHRSVDHEAEKIWPHAPLYFTSLNWCAGLFFLTEMLLYMLGYGLDYFRDFWHWLDMACVALFLYDKVVSTVILGGGTGIRILRLLRVVRLVRLVRYVRAVHHLYIMTAALKGMIVVVYWSMVLLTSILSTSALVLTSALHVTYFDGMAAKNLSTTELETHQKLYEYFGTFTRCLLSMFEITLANYSQVTRCLVEEVSEWFILICLAHKLAIGFAVVGVINAVILQETFRVSSLDDYGLVRQQMRTKYLLVKKLKKLFKAVDDDGDGIVTKNELASIQENPEIKAWLTALGIHTEDIPTLFALLDVDGDQEVTEEEFVSRIVRLKGPAHSMDVLALRKQLYL